MAAIQQIRDAPVPRVERGRGATRRCASRSPGSNASSSAIDGRHVPTAARPDRRSHRWPARACSSLGELERVRDALAARLSTLAAAAAEQAARQAVAARRARADARRPAGPQMGAAHERRPRSARLHHVPRPSARRAARHADGLVAGQDLGWLSVTSPKADAGRRMPGRRNDEPPKAPWHPFPLVELCVLAGIVLLVLGLFEQRHRRAAARCSSPGWRSARWAGSTPPLREHFAGFKPHTLVLAGVPTVVLAGVLYFLRAPWIAVLDRVPRSRSRSSCRLLWQAYRRHAPLP